MVVLLISGLLGLLPLLGIVYIVKTSNGITVDALFMSLILLTISGIFFLNIVLELRARLASAGSADPPSTAAFVLCLGLQPLTLVHMVVLAVDQLAVFHVLPAPEADDDGFHKLTQPLNSSSAQTPPEAK